MLASWHPGPRPSHPRSSGETAWTFPEVIGELSVNLLLPKLCGNKHGEDVGELTAQKEGQAAAIKRTFKPAEESSAMVKASP